MWWEGIIFLFFPPLFFLSPPFLLLILSFPRGFSRFGGIARAVFPGPCVARGRERERKGEGEAGKEEGEREAKGKGAGFSEGEAGQAITQGREGRVHAGRRASCTSPALPCRLRLRVALGLGTAGGNPNFIEAKGVGLRALLHCRSRDSARRLGGGFNTAPSASAPGVDSISFTLTLTLSHMRATAQAGRAGPRRSTPPPVAITTTPAAPGPRGAEPRALRLGDRGLPLASGRRAALSGGGPGAVWLARCGTLDAEAAPDTRLEAGFARDAEEARHE